MEEVEFKLSLYRCVGFELKKKRGGGEGNQARGCLERGMNSVYSGQKKRSAECGCM